jgi:hypothetical protein
VHHSESNDSPAKCSSATRERYATIAIDIFGANEEKKCKGVQALARTLESGMS